MLYHYTSINSLVQILENKNLKFNNLTACDDLDEAESEDLGRIGKFVFISSWTNEASESIPMWSQYSGNMSGIRIGMRENPFRIKHFDNIGHGKIIDSYLNLDQYYNENKMAFAANQPTLVKVEYVEDEEKIRPKVFAEGEMQDIMRFIQGEDARFSIFFEPIGKYKRTCWAFQCEYRYKITGTPVGLKELEGLNLFEGRKKQIEFLQRITDKSYTPGYQALFVDLDDEAIRNMEIVFGPRMTVSEKILVKTFLKSKGLENNWRDSSLRIQ